MKRVVSTAFAVVLLTFFVGCSNGDDPSGLPAGGDNPADTGGNTGGDGTGDTGDNPADVSLSVAEIEALIVELELQMDEYAESEFNGSAGVQTGELTVIPGEGVIEVDIDVTRECYGGGELVLAGTATREVAGDPLMVTLDAEGTRTYTACGVGIGRHGEGLPAEEDAMLFVDGELEMTLHREWSAEDWYIARTATAMGTLDWSKDTGESGTCDLDLTSTLDSAVGLFTVTGTACDEEIDYEIPWPPELNEDWTGPAGT